MSQPQDTTEPAAGGTAGDSGKAVAMPGCASASGTMQAAPGAPGEIIRIGMGPTLSEAAICNGIVYLAGQVADDVTQNIGGQTRQVLAHVGRLLTQAGSDRSRILMCQIFLADIKDFDEMNQVWNGWVMPGHAPPRATVEAKLARPEWLVEIVATAAIAASAA